MRRIIAVASSTCIIAAACGRGADVLAPPSRFGPVTSIRASDAIEPNFNLEVILRAPEGSVGFGHVKFRQNNDDVERVDLGVWVRDLSPDTHYRLQRATDTPVDDVCTSNSWLTLGEGATPQDVITDDRGTAKQDLFRVLTGAVGSSFDIRFRVVTTSGVPVLLSECYQFFIR